MHLITLSSIIFALFLSLSHALITSESEALALAPALKLHGDKLETVLDGYRSLHYAIAALRIRTLIPHYTLSNNNTSSKKGPLKLSRHQNPYAKSDDSDDNEFNSDTILANHLKNSLRGIRNAEIVDQVFAFNLTANLANFTAQKEAEAQAKLLEALPILQTIKSLLKIEPSPSDTIPISFAFLKQISSVLSCIYPNLKDIEIYTPKLDSPDQVKRETAQEYVATSRAQILKLTQNLSALLSP